MIKALCEANSHDCWIPFTNGQWFGLCHDIIYVIMRTTPGTCYLDIRSMDKHLSGWYRAYRVIWVFSLRDAPLCVQIIGVFYQGERMGYQVIQERMGSIKGWWNRLFLSTSCTVLLKSVHQTVSQRPPNTGTLHVVKLKYYIFYLIPIYVLQLIFTMDTVLHTVLGATFKELFITICNAQWYRACSIDPRTDLSLPNLI